METQKIEKAWKAFQSKMTDLKKRQFEILSSISKKMDKQEIEKIQADLRK